MAKRVAPVMRDLVEVQQLFTDFTNQLESAGFHMALGADGLCGPYIQILDLPERRGQVTEITPSNRTTIRIHTYDDHLRYLRNSYPSLTERIAEVVQAGRPFLVMETRFRYIELGKQILSFARERSLNIRCIDHEMAESRLNDLRMYFDEDAFCWKAASGSVDDLLRDPRDHQRTWTEGVSFRLGRTADKIKLLGHRPPVRLTTRTSARDGRLAAGATGL